MLITGDHPATAAAIGGQVGIWRDGDPVARGDDGDPRRRAPETPGCSPAPSRSRSSTSSPACSTAATWWR